jgi:hypothetical protein
MYTQDETGLAGLQAFRANAADSGAKRGCRHLFNTRPTDIGAAVE